MMMDCYPDDTLLTSADRHRTTSRKLFHQQWQQRNTEAKGEDTTQTTGVKPQQQQQKYFQLLHQSMLQGSTSFDQQPPAPSPHQFLLHRSPSGAQRKIRQKAQQQQFSVSSNNGFLVPSPAAAPQVTPPPQLPPPTPSYRSVVQENGYKSILGTRERSATDGTGGSPSVGQLLDRMNRLDSVMINSAGPNESGSIDKMPSSASLMGSMLTNDHRQQQQPTTPFAKPTVQVHPLPVPPRHRSLSVISTTAKLTPPPLPPKKQSPMPLVRATKGKDGDNVDLEPDNNSRHQRQQSAGETPLIDWDKTEKSPDPVLRWASSASVPSALLNDFGTSEVPPPRTPLATAIIRDKDSSASVLASPPSSLSSSPSLTSLQNILQFAADNPEKHSREQLRELEQRRLQSIESLARKIKDREQDRELLSGDLAEIGQIRASLIARIAHNPPLISRLRIHLAQLEKMAELDTKLHCQLERIGTKRRDKAEGKRKDGEGEGRSTDMARRLREQIADLHFVRKAFEERERAMDAEMAEELGEAEGVQEWLFCREQLAKLAAERCHLDQRLRDVRALLQSLQSIRLATEEEASGGDGEKGENGPKEEEQAMNE